MATGRVFRNQNNSIIVDLEYVIAVIFDDNDLKVTLYMTSSEPLVVPFTSRWSAMELVDQYSSYLLQRVDAEASARY